MTLMKVLITLYDVIGYCEFTVWHTFVALEFGQRDAWTQNSGRMIHQTEANTFIEK
jgi:hypothetical protein